jgi:hypothetical protein
MSSDLANLKIADFSPHIDEVFELEAANGAKVPLTLTAADAHGMELPTDLKGRTGEALKARQGGGFSLNFTASEARVLPQGIYPIEHPTLGPIHLFLVPSGLIPNGGVTYHVVFN